MNLRYTECLDVMPAGYEEAHAVYSNRSLAYAKVSCRLNECRQTRHAEQTNKPLSSVEKGSFFVKVLFILCHVNTTLMIIMYDTKLTGQ